MTNRERGMVTLECLLVIPMFLLLIVTMVLAFGALHREAMMQEAVNETVKIVASSSVIAVALPALPSLPPEWDALLSLVPDEWIDTFVNKAQQKTMQWHALWVVPLVYAHIDEPKQRIDRAQIQLEQIVLPIGTERFFGIRATYTWHIPIFQRPLVIRVAAMERCWVGI